MGREKNMAAPAIYERLRTTGYPWKRANDRYKNGQPKVSPNSFEYALRYTLDGDRYFRTFKTVENLMATLAQVEVQIHAAKNGIQLVNPLSAKQRTNQESLVSAVQRYTDEVKANKSHRTWTAYHNSLRHFVASCRKPTVQQVVREDLLAFKTYCKSLEHEEGTIYNNFLNVMVFFKWANRPTGVKAEDWPKKPKSDPKEFSDEELEAMLKVADSEERLILKSFLFSAMREGELAHLTYGDIDFRDSLWRVRAKPQWDWTLKTQAAQRDIPVCAKQTKKILERMKEKGKKPTDLIFPNANGGPDGHLLRIVKAVAKRAGLDPEEVYCHKFRSTQITRWLQAGCSPTDVVRWVGHVNLDTIMIYAAKVDLRNKYKRAKADAASEKFVDVGD
jgi:integrase